jgi:hypothetical protein
LEAANERARGVAFHDQVEMIGLHREVENAEGRAVRLNEGPLKRLEGPRRPQGGEASLRT